jgi:DNA-directed RNA polymerase specialized sigma24 family protein
MDINLNEDDFEKQILQQRDFLISYSHVFTRCIDESEDIVQETIISAFKHRDSYRSEGSLRAWLVSILRALLHNGFAC